MNICVELVPKSMEALKKDLELIKNDYPMIKSIGIADMYYVENKGYEGGKLSKNYFEQTIPHLRAMDYDIANETEIFKTFKDNNLKEVVIVQGDVPENNEREVYKTTTLQMMEKFRKEIPDIKIYGAIDPHRGSMEDEIAYTNAKIKAGADGFFTQPFFDLDRMEEFYEKINDTEIYWGLSPVISSKAQEFWQDQVKTVFPNDFVPTIEWNKEFTKNVMDFSKKTKTNVFLIPAMVSTKKYLEIIFND